MSSGAKRLASRAAIVLACGIVAFATGAIVVHAATSAQLSKKKQAQSAWPAFMIRTTATAPLSPGRSAPLRISLANNRIKPIWITKLSVLLAVDQAHASRGCSVDRDYRVTQVPKSLFPIKLAGHYKATKKREARLRWRTLRSRRTRGKPYITMLDLRGVNQNACKGATLTINFVSKSSNKKPKHKKAWKA